MRIMFDTNILLSAIAFKSTMMAKIIKNVQMEHEILLCQYVIGEFEDVADKKMPKQSAALKKVLSDLPYTKVKSAVWQPCMGDLRDEKDKPILAAAILADADMIITGDKDFLESGITHPQIISHLDFLRDYMD
ncbi:MAG: putative toxin-antitoxin system toxin component, PIN family [Turicibacter sp.]|nr:putative toxin-antitoxin system toxin component, PIN family [Turicibacter sp.]